MWKNVFQNTKMLDFSFSGWGETSLNPSVQNPHENSQSTSDQQPKLSRVMRGQSPAELRQEKCSGLPSAPASSCYSSSLSWVERSLVWHTATSYTLSGIQNTWQGGKVHSANCSDITSKFLPGKMLVFLPYVMLLKQRYWYGTNNGHFIYHSFASIAMHSCLLSVHLSSTDISAIADKLLPPYKNKEANKRH